MNVTLNQVTAAIEVALRVLAARWLALLALLMTSGLYAWAMFLQSWLAFGIAAGFGVSVFLPTLATAKFSKPSQSQDSDP